jgi:malonate transporter
MLDILAITSPIFITMLLGFLATRFGLFAKPEMRVFGTFVVKLALPALLFKALAQRQIGEILNGSYVLAYLSGTLAVISLGYCWSRRMAGLSPTTSTFYAMGMGCSNSSFIGYPILLLILPSVAGVALALNVIVENVIVLPLLLAFAERGRDASGPLYRVIGRSLRRLATNPLIIAVAAGLFASLIGWKMPAPVDRTVTMIAVSSGALSLFVIGGTLVGLPMHGMVRRAAPIAFGKLIVHPIAVLLAISMLTPIGLPPPVPSLRLAALLLAAMPMMSIYPILAQAYGQEDFSATALLITTVASFFTLSGLLWVFRHLAI